MWLFNILTPMHAREWQPEAPPAARRIETVAIAATDEAWKEHEALSNTAPSGVPIQPFPIVRLPNAFLYATLIGDMPHP